MVADFQGMAFLMNPGELVPVYRVDQFKACRLLIAGGRGWPFGQFPQANSTIVKILEAIFRT